MAEQLLDAAEVGAAFEHVRGAAVPEQVRIDPARVEAGCFGPSAYDQIDAGARERATAAVQEELAALLLPVE